MVEIDNYIRRLKSSWIKRFVNDCKLKLIQLLEYRINFDKTLYLGSDIINTLLWTSEILSGKTHLFQNIQVKSEGEKGMNLSANIV